MNGYTGSCGVGKNSKSSRVVYTATYDLAIRIAAIRINLLQPVIIDAGRGIRMGESIRLFQLGSAFSWQRSDIIKMLCIGTVFYSEIKVIIFAGGGPIKYHVIARNITSKKEQRNRQCIAVVAPESELREA